MLEIRKFVYKTHRRSHAQWMEGLVRHPQQPHLLMARSHHTVTVLLQSKRRS